MCTYVHAYVWCTLGCPSTYNTCIHVKTPPPHPHTPPHFPHLHSLSPHSIPSTPHDLIPSPSAQTLINTSTSKSDINPPQSQEHTTVSQHGYPYTVLMSDSLSLTSSITMSVLQDSGLLAYFCDVVYAGQVPSCNKVVPKESTHVKAQ